MLWRKKKKTEKINYDKYFEEFLKFKDSKDREAEYKAINGLYNEIYVLYRSLINKEMIEIKTEKLLVERRVGRYTSEKSKTNVTILIGMACAILPIYVQGFSELNIKYKAFISIASVVGIFYMIIRDISKDIIKDKNRDVMYNICLKVLEDIEKEQAEKEKILKEQKDKDEMYKKIEEIVNKNNILHNVIMPDIYEVTAGTVKKDGWVRRLLSKKK